MYTKDCMGEYIIMRLEMGAFVMVRKIKILISLFVVMLILSMDLGTLFSTGKDGIVTAEGHEMFEFANLQHNLGCITGAIKSAVVAKNDTVPEEKTEKKEDTNLVDKYGSALADATTKAVEDAIVAKNKESGVEKTSMEK